MPVPVLAVVAVVVSLAVVAAAVGATHVLTARTAADAAAPNANCTLIVPANPLSAQGLATPYQLTATDPAAGPCNEANSAQTAFVQGAIINPATGTISIYDPLVVDAGTQPAVTPTVPTLPAGGVVALWFGYNGNTLTLAGADQAQSLLDPAASATPTARRHAPSATQAAFVAGPAQRAGLEVTGSAPLPPAGSGSDAGYDATLTRIAGSGSTAGQAGNPPRHHHPSPSTSASASASATAMASASATSSTGTGTPADPPATGDVPAASGTPDAILQQASCVAGEDINGQFSSFTQVGACNAPAFFAAANTAIKAGKLTVPQPGIARDGQRCLTTRSFALIDQDQSDNVTTEYLAEPNGQTAQDTAANKQGLNGSSVLFNGSDNGLLDLFVDPALGCSPWEAPNLADGGAPAPSLPLDELQAARWANSPGSPAALVPLNDPMTVDENGNFSTDKTNTYRSLVDMSMLPAGQSPAAYCSDMEQIQGKRLQQDVNLLLNAPSPDTGAADNLFTFMAMRLQQSFTNLNCGNFGQQNDVSFSSDANGVVVAACFSRQFAPVTRGPGNPMAGQRQCPATAGSAPGGAGTTPYGHADPQAVTERPRVFLHAQASPPLVVVTATINGSLQNGRRHGGEWPGSRRRVLSSPAPTSEGRSMSHESQQDQRATRRGVLLGVGIAGIGGVLAGVQHRRRPVRRRRGRRGLRPAGPGRRRARRRWRASPPRRAAAPRWGRCSPR